VLRRALAGLLVLLAVPAWPAGQVAQNPSPMSDTTRPHPRTPDGPTAGKRLTMRLGQLFLSDRFLAREHVPLVVHFHGDPRLIEQHIAQSAPAAALLAINLGAGSSRYADSFADPARFRILLDEAASGVGMITGRRPVWSSITLTSFSAGYGAVRAILQVPDNATLVSSVLLADSLHASYLTEGDVAAPRSADLPVDPAGIAAFVSFAGDAAANRKRFWITHSEVYPGTYASTTETANELLASLKIERRPVLQQGPIGMQQLSAARAGGFVVAGFAGNSAPDHLDHLYAIGDWLREWNVVR
jgi:hypothetical protein